MELEPFEIDSDKKENANPYHGMNLSGFNQTQRPNQAYPIFVDADGMVVDCGKSLQERTDTGVYTGENADFFDYSEAPEGPTAIWPIAQNGDPCVWRLIPENFMQSWEKGYIRVVPNKKGRNKYITGLRGNGSRYSDGIPSISNTIAPISLQKMRRIFLMPCLNISQR